MTKRVLDMMAWVRGYIEIGFIEDEWIIGNIGKKRNLSSCKMQRRVKKFSRRYHDTNMSDHICSMSEGHPLEEYEIPSFYRLERYLTRSTGEQRLSHISDKSMWQNKITRNTTDIAYRSNTLCIRRGFLIYCSSFILTLCQLLSCSHESIEIEMCVWRAYNYFHKDCICRSS
jgi:hypothetical protein